MGLVLQTDAGTALEEFMSYDLMVAIGTPEPLTRILYKELPDQVLTWSTAASFIKSHITSLNALLEILLGVTIEWHSSNLSHLIEKHTECPPVRGCRWWC